MTDEQQQPQLPPPEPPKETHTTKLERLPADIKTELDEFILAGNGSSNVKELLEKKFQHRTDILPADRKTYWVYMTENKVRLEEEAKLRNQLLDFSKEEMEMIQQNVAVTQDAAVTGEIQDIRDALQKLQTFMAKRIDDMTKLQNNASPMNRTQYEAYIGAYVKEMHSILGTLLKHQTELKNNVEERFIKRSKQMYYLIVVAGLDAFKAMVLQQGAEAEQVGKMYEAFALIFQDKCEKILRDFALEEARKNS